MKFIGNVIRFLCAPVFLAMAWVNYQLNAMAPHAAADMANMPGMAMPPAGATLYSVHLDPQIVAAIGSWWLMYLLMGIGCLPAWFGLFDGKSKPKTKSRPAAARHFSD